MFYCRGRDGGRHHVLPLREGRVLIPCFTMVGGVTPCFTFEGEVDTMFYRGRGVTPCFTVEGEVNTMFYRGRGVTPCFTPPGDTNPLDATEFGDSCSRATFQRASFM